MLIGGLSIVDCLYKWILKQLEKLQFVINNKK